MGFALFVEQDGVIVTGHSVLYFLPSVRVEPLLKQLLTACSPPVLGVLGKSIYSEAIRRSNWREALENEDERFTAFAPSDAVLKNVLERSHFQCVNDARPRVSSEDLLSALNLKEFSSRLGPLHGVPYGLKDIFALPGYRTTWGSKS